MLFKRKKIDLRLFVFYWKSHSGATVQAGVLHLWSFKAGVRNQFLTPANSHSMLFPTILSINKKTRLSSSLFDEVSFLLSCIYVAKNPAHLCGAGILISFVQFWCFVAQTLQGSSIRKLPQLRGKQKLKIIIYDNFKYLHSTSLQILIMARWLVFFLNSLESLIRYLVVGYSSPLRFEQSRVASLHLILLIVFG